MTIQVDKVYIMNHRNGATYIDFSETEIFKNVNSIIATNSGYISLIHYSGDEIAGIPFYYNPIITRIDENETQNASQNHRISSIS